MLLSNWTTVERVESAGRAYDRRGYWKVLGVEVIFPPYVRPAQHFRTPDREQRRAVAARAGRRVSMATAVELACSR